MPKQKRYALKADLDAAYVHLRKALAAMMDIGKQISADHPEFPVDQKSLDALAYTSFLLLFAYYDFLSLPTPGEKGNPPGV